MKQSIQAVTKLIHAQLSLPGSKSITNRALLIAALARGVSTLSNVSLCDDTYAMIQVLKELGIKIEVDREKQSCVVQGANGKFPKTEAKINCNKAGTVARFLTAACAATAGTFYFDADKQLHTRPMEILFQILKSQGAEFIFHGEKNFPFTVKGAEKLSGGSIIIDSHQTGQFVSALLMAAPFAKNTLKIEAAHLVSAPYVEMTCAMMSEFGVLVRRVPAGHYSVPIPQYYEARDYLIEPDLSTASYFFAAAAITKGEITIQKINREKSKQADISFLKTLEKMGCTVVENSAGLTVKGANELKGVNVDMRDAPDTFMTLAAIAPFATTPTTMTNISHARHKESDRISVMCNELKKLKIKVEEGSDWIKIFPSDPVGAEIESHDDHRIAMAFSVIGLRVPDVVIQDAECVSKSFPGFFELWSMMKN